MWAIIRINCRNIGNQIVGLHKNSAVNPAILQQAAFISHADKRQDLPPKPKPYPYRTRNYTYYYPLFDNTVKRFDENTRIIVVEGLPSVGKDKFCRDLAKEFGWKYMQPLTFDDLYKRGPDYVDRRQYDDELPVNIHTHDLKKYVKQPVHQNTAIFQTCNYQLKFDRYADALIHLMSTGQGVVLQRSPFSDLVYVEAMVKAGYLSKEYHYYYYELTKRTLHLLLKPHVIIYLDIDAKKSLANIKKDGNPDEVNSKVYTQSYLENIEKNYKTKFFNNLEPYCHIMNYDWSDGGDVDFVVEDLESLNFEFKQSDTKMEDWNTDDSDLWRYRRYLFSPFRRQSLIHRLNNILHYDCEEMFMSGEEDELLHAFRERTPGFRFHAGFEPKFEKNIMFKTKCPPPMVYLRSKETILADQFQEELQAIGAA